SSGNEHLQPQDPRIRLPRRADLLRSAARRRGEPHAAAHPIRAARSDAGTGRDDRRRAAADLAGLPGRRHPEPDRVRGDLSAPRSAARPLPAEDFDRPAQRGRRDRGARRLRVRSSAARGGRESLARDVDLGAGRRASAGFGIGAGRAGAALLHPTRGGEDPRPRIGADRSRPARLTRAPRRGARDRPPARARFRDAGRRQGDGRAGAGPSGDPHPRSGDGRRAPLRSAAPDLRTGGGPALSPSAPSGAAKPRGSFRPGWRPTSRSIRALGLAAAVALLAPWLPWMIGPAAFIALVLALLAGREARALRRFAFVVERPERLVLSLGEDEQVPFTIQVRNVRAAEAGASLKLRLRQLWPDLIDRRASAAEAVVPLRAGSVSAAFELAVRAVKRGSATLRAPWLAVTRDGWVERLVEVAEATEQEGSQASFTVLPSLLAVRRMRRELEIG